MHALLGYGPEQQQVVADLEKVERAVIRENFFETVTGYLNARGLRHRPQVRGRGLARDFFEAFAESDVPEIEEEVFLPEAVWTAHALGRPIVSAEAFTFLSGHGRNLERDGQQRVHTGPLADPQRQWETNPAMLRWHAGAHFARGVNRIQMHSFGYSPLGVPPPGWRIYAEVHLNRHVPWWPYMKPVSTWLARMQWVLQSGAPVADALVYPVRSNPPDGPYNQATDQPASALNAIDAASPYTLSRLKKQGGETPYDFSRLVLIDDVRTRERGAAHPGTGRRAATVLVCCRTMPDDWSALRNAADRRRIAARPSALRWSGGRSWMPEPKAGRRRWPMPSRSAGAPASANLSFQHRRVAGGEIYLLTNWGPAFRGEVSFPHADLAPEIWNADTGTCLPAGQYRVEQGWTAVTLELDPHESAVVVFTRAQPSLHAVRCEGGRVAYDPAGRLRVRLDAPGPCRVELSDGQTRELRVTLPPPIALDRPLDARRRSRSGSRFGGAGRRSSWTSSSPGARSPSCERTRDSPATKRRSICHRSFLARRRRPAAGTGRGLRVGRRVVERPPSRHQLVPAARPRPDRPRSARPESAPHRCAQHPQEPLGARRVCPALGPAGAGSRPARRHSLSAGDHTMMTAPERANVTVLTRVLVFAVFASVSHAADFTNSLGLSFVRIEPGRFQMGFGGRPLG